MRECRTTMTILSLLLLLGCAAEPSNASPGVESVPVEVEVTEKRAFTPEILLLGRIESHEDVPVLTPQAGTISYPQRFLQGLRTGVPVERGEVLAMISNETARLELSEARLQARAAEQYLDRIQRGFEGGITTSAELSDATIQAEIAGARLESAERRSSRLLIRAPRTGTLVVSDRWPAGTDVPALETIASIAAGGDPRVVARASAEQRRRLRPGMNVDLLESSSNATIAAGNLEEIDSVVDEIGTARVVIRIPTNSADLVAGEGVLARVLLDTRDAITLPERAIIHASSGSYVFTVENGRARRTTVMLGSRAGNRTEIVEGLEPGDQVVTTGAAFLSDGMSVATPETRGAQG